MDPQIWQDLARLRPEIILSAAFLVVIVVDLAWPKRPKVALWLTVVGLAAAFVATLGLVDTPAGTLFFGMLAIDRQAVFFKGFLLLASFLVLLAAPGSKELARSHLGEFYALL